MRSYAEREIFTDAEQELFLLATQYVAKISNKYGNEIRCHELARAVHAALLDKPHLFRADLFQLTVTDGMLGPIDHSWIECHGMMQNWPQSLPRRFILDAYCPGRLPQVQLVDRHYAIARGYTIDCEQRTDIRDALVEKLTAEMLHDE